MSPNSERSIRRGHVLERESRTGVIGHAGYCAIERSRFGPALCRPVVQYGGK